MRGSMYRRVRQIAALVVGLAFALATSTSVVSATGMAMKLGAVCSASVTAADKCDGCGSSGSGCDMAAMDCAATMCAPLMAAVPRAMPTVGLALQPPPLASTPALVGWPSSPDPHPPRAFAPAPPRWSARAGPRRRSGPSATRPACRRNLKAVTRCSSMATCRSPSSASCWPIVQVIAAAPGLEQDLQLAAPFTRLLRGRS